MNTYQRQIKKPKAVESEQEKLERLKQNLIEMAKLKEPK